MALELRLQLCTFENSTNCNEISFDPHSFFRIAKRSIESHIHFFVVFTKLSVPYCFESLVLKNN